MISINRFIKKYPGVATHARIVRRVANKYKLNVKMQLDKFPLCCIEFNNTYIFTIDITSFKITTKNRCEFNARKFLNLNIFEGYNFMARTKKESLTLLELFAKVVSLIQNTDLVIDDEKEEEEKPARNTRTKAKPAAKPEAKSRRSSSSRKPKKDNREKLETLAEEYIDEFSEKELEELLDDIAEVNDIGDVPDDMIDEVIEELKAELDMDGDDGEEEVTAEAVKIAVQAYQKKNGKEDTEELLENYGIKTVRSLGKLEQDQLEDLFADVTKD